jgi:hypothetical protein
MHGGQVDGDASLVVPVPAGPPMTVGGVSERDGYGAAIKRWGACATVVTLARHVGAVEGEF